MFVKVNTIPMRHHYYSGWEWTSRLNIDAISRIRADEKGTIFDSSHPNTDYYYFSPHPVETVERAIAICKMKIAREENAGRMRLLVGANTPEPPLTSWCLDLSDHAKIELVEIAADVSDPDRILSGDLAIAVKRAPRPPAPHLRQG